MADLAECGLGVPVDWTTGRRLTRNRGILAAPAAIHGAVVAAAQTVLGAATA